MHMAISTRTTGTLLRHLFRSVDCMDHVVTDLPKPQMADDPQTLLVHAAATNDADGVRRQLGRGACVHRRMRGPCCPGMSIFVDMTAMDAALAARPLAIAAILALVDAGAPIDGHDHSGMTPLMHAAQHASVSDINSLLSSGAGLHRINATTSMTTMDYALLAKRIDVALVLIEAGVSADHIDRNGMTALMHASTAGSLEQIRELLTLGASVQISSPISGRTALDYALASGRIDAVIVLIEAGAPVDHATDGRTALGLACRVGTESDVRSVLSLGANVTISACCGSISTVTNSTITTAMDSALSSHYVSPRHIANVLVLIEHGFPVDARDRKAAQTPLMWAARYGTLQQVQKLVHVHGANVAALVPGTRMTAADLAAKLRRLDIVAYLSHAQVPCSCHSCLVDIPLLRAEVQRLHAALAEFQASRANTMAVSNTNHASKAEPNTITTPKVVSNAIATPKAASNAIATPATTPIYSTPFITNHADSTASIVSSVCSLKSFDGDDHTVNSTPMQRCDSLDTAHTLQEPVVTLASRF